MVQIFEYLLRCAQRLLEDVVDADQALQRFQKHEQRGEETGERAGGEGAALDLQARVVQQPDDGERRAEIDHRRGKPLLQHVADVGLEQAVRRLAEAARFVVLGGEGLHHHVAAQGLLKNLVDLGLALLRVAAGAADAAAHAHGGQHHGGHHHQADQRQPRIVAEEHVQQKDRGKELAQQVGQNLRSGHLDLIDVVHDGRHQLAGGVSLEELRALLQDLIEDRVAQSGDAGESGVTDQVVAQVIAEPLDEEGQQQRRGDHGPGAAAEWNEAVQIELVAEEGMGQQRDSARRERWGRGRDRRPAESAAAPCPAPRRRAPSARRKAESAASTCGRTTVRRRS